jgi:chromosome segregation ATPase
MGLPFQQPQYMQPMQQQSLIQSQPPAADDSVSEAQPAALQQLQHGTASLSMQDVMGLVESVKDLQKKTKGLEKQLSDAHSHEKQLNDMAYAAQYRSTSVDQSARKLAQLAQTSVLQAQQSMDQEKNVVNDLKKRLIDGEKERSALQQELSQTQATMNSLQSAMTSAQRREREALKAQQAAEQQAKEAEAREMRAVKAGEFEDTALSRQEELISRMRAAAPAAESYRDLDLPRRGNLRSSAAQRLRSPRPQQVLRHPRETRRP